MSDPHTSENPAFDAWCYRALSTLQLDGKPLPLLTELFYSICGNDQKKLGRALEILQAAFEAGASSAEAEIAELDAALFFNSNKETHHRIMKRTPEHDRRREVDAIEARAIERHLARTARRDGREQ